MKHVASFIESPPGEIWPRMRRGQSSTMSLFKTNAFASLSFYQVNSKHSRFDALKKESAQVSATNRT